MNIICYKQVTFARLLLIQKQGERWLVLVRNYIDKKVLEMQEYEIEDPLLEYEVVLHFDQETKEITINQ
jgi:hypothetical protein